jgi:release factor glutamine methyltransferase
MGVNIQTIKDIRVYLSGELNSLYPEEEISSIAGIIIRTVTGLSRLHQIYDQGQAITEGQAEKIIEYSAELLTGKPLQYVIGETIFYDCKIKVNSSTLIPRPETEELADLIIKENRNFKGTILDIGTGSGCIAIALSKNISGAEVMGTDISEEALNTANENASLNMVRVKFVENDILNPGSLLKFKAGIIVSNPPYVKESERTLMKQNVLDFEPHTALFVPDDDPLLFYRAIKKSASGILIPGGSIYLEINEALGKEMLSLFQSQGYSEVKLIRDINGKDRILKATKNG